ncbi:cellular tumor antigen p53-like [Spodoptera frugiperda]|nr:cellular tumor antigen p53-like [Spodoptera frugiperda]
MEHHDMPYEELASDFQIFTDPDLMLNMENIETSNIDLSDIVHQAGYPQSPGSETMDIASASIVEFPFSPQGRPPHFPFAGNLNFTLEVNSKDVHKKTFLYSHRLNRIYVDRKCNFSIQFNWDYIIAPQMFVRATVVFSDETQAEKRVERCVQHYHESSTAGMQAEIAKNVLHSSREIGTQGVYYCGNVDMADSWYSVLVQFDRTGPEPCTHAYQFSCKNSCTTGINRRAIAIIFTLEDKTGKVYGRQKVGARVCACPRRDMVKDETAEGVYKTGKKRIPSNQIDPPKTKKIKVENNLMEFDDKVYKLPPLEIVGSRAALCGLKTMLEMMELAVECRKKNEPDVTAQYAQRIVNLKNAIQKIENLKTPPPPPLSQ